MNDKILIPVEMKDIAENFVLNATGNDCEDIMKFIQQLDLQVADTEFTTDLIKNLLISLHNDVDDKELCNELIYKVDKL